MAERGELDCGPREFDFYNHSLNRFVLLPFKTAVWCKFVKLFSTKTDLKSQVIKERILIDTPAIFRRVHRNNSESRNQNMIQICFRIHRTQIYK